MKNKFLEFGVNLNTLLLFITLASFRRVFKHRKQCRCSFFMLMCARVHFRDAVVNTLDGAVGRRTHFEQLSTACLCCWMYSELCCYVAPSRVHRGGRWNTECGVEGLCNDTLEFPSSRIIYWYYCYNNALLFLTLF